MHKSHIIGFSENKNPINVIYLGDKSFNESTLKILIIAGQHGDEKCGRESVNRLMSTDFNEFPSMQLAIISDANPDGSHNRTRVNAKGVDLNRDHQILDSAETRTVHSFVRMWKPHLIVDVHNYPPRRKHLLANNHVIYYDVFIDIPTNPSIRINNDKSAQLLDTIKSDLESFGISCERYTIITPSGRVRHSTPDVADARNALSLRYNTTTILLEARNPTRDDVVKKEQLISAQHRALYLLLKWAQKNKDHLIRDKRLIPYKKEVIAIRSKYVKADHPIEIKFKNSLTKQTEIVSFDKYTPSLEITKYIKLPIAYAVPKIKTKVIEILQRHGFKSESLDSDSHVECYVVKSMQLSRHRNRSARRMSLETYTEYKKLNDYVIFPTLQEGGHTLAVFLEPESKYGLNRYADLELTVSPGSTYPVLRVIN